MSVRPEARLEIAHLAAVYLRRPDRPIARLQAIARLAGMIDPQHRDEHLTAIVAISSELEKFLDAEDLDGRALWDAQALARFDEERDDELAFYASRIEESLTSLSGVPQGEGRAVRVYIRDEIDSPQRYDLQRLLRLTCAAFGVPATSRCLVHACWGYGERVNEMERSADPTVLTVAELDELAEGLDEWFYDIRVSLLDGTVHLGLHDSSAMFVEGDAAGVREVAAAFVDLVWDG